MLKKLTENEYCDFEHEFVQYGQIRNESAPIGDLLSRLWGHFGAPQVILFEGFIYYIKDQETGLKFEISFGASGPKFSAEITYIAKLKSIFVAFEKLLDSSPNADCEIEVDTDWGTFLCGAKNGIPYDKEKDQNEEQNLLIDEVTADHYYDDLIFNIKNDLESYMHKHKPSFKEMDINACITYLTAYVEAVSRSKTVDEMLFALKMIMMALNNLNKGFDHTLISESAKEKIIEIINMVSDEKGYNLFGRDITEEWREW